MSAPSAKSWLWRGAETFHPAWLPSELTAGEWPAAALPHETPWAPRAPREQSRCPK